MNLYFQSYPEAKSDAAINDEQSAIVIIPGLFGSTSNWRSVAKRLSERQKVMVIDQRNHGRSPHSDSNSYQDMVNDLREFCDHHDLDQIVLCGHSMGGKVAMLFALQFPETVEKLIVLDIAPISYPDAHSQYIKALLKLDLEQLKSRGEADRQLREFIPEIATRMFLLQSLTGSPGKYYWKLNLHTLLNFMDDIVGFPSVDKESPVRALFVNGALSDYLNVEHQAKIRSFFPRVKFTSIADAGHWLHADRPAEVQNHIENFIKE